MPAVRQPLIEIKQGHVQENNEPGDVPRNTFPQFWCEMCSSHRDWANTSENHSIAAAYIGEGKSASEAARHLLQSLKRSNDRDVR